MKPYRMILAGLGLATLTALSGCQSVGVSGGGGVQISDAAYNLSVRLADTIGRCWFAAGDTTFAGYVYSPERNASVSRILLVKKSDPTGLPALVVQATSGSSASVYGPLAEGANGPRIRADIARWAKGGTGCS